MDDKIYWLSFHISDVTTAKGTYQKRYAALTDTITGLSTAWWAETTSFYVLRTAMPIEAMVSAISQAISLGQDTALLGMPHVKSMRLIGASDYPEVLLDMVEFVKKV